MRVYGDGYELLNKAIEEASYTTTLHVPSTKQELKQVYIQEYGRSWQKHLSEDMSQITGQKAHNESRAFNPDRIDKRVGGKKAAQYASLGRRHATEEKTPKDIKGKRARVSFTGDVCISEDCRDRHFNATLLPSQASEMKRGSFNPIFEAWGPGMSQSVKSIDVYHVSVDFL